MEYQSSGKLNQLLESLTKEEYKELGLWVQSPIHNPSKRTIKLYDALKYYKNRNKKPQLTSLLKALDIIKEKVRKDQITKGQLQQYRKVASKFTIQIEQFLIWKRSNEDPVQCNVWLMDQMLERQLYHLIPSTLNKTKKAHLSNPLRDITFCNNQFELDQMALYLDIFLRNRKAAKSLVTTINSLEVASFSRLLRYYCAQINSSNLFTTKENLPFIPIIQNIIERSNFKNQFTVKIYHKLLGMLDTGKPEDYFEFKKLLFSDFNAFNKTELRQFFGFMSNFCIDAELKGVDSFKEESFEIYKTGLNLKCWTAGIYFSQHQFVNIVASGLRLNKTKWVDNFIQDHRKKLPPEEQEDIVHLCLAKLHFTMKEYDKAHEFLLQIRTTEDLMYHLQFNLLLLKIYYVNEPFRFDNFDSLPIHSRLKAFYAYLNIASGKKMSDIRRSAYSNFLSVLKRLLSVKKKFIFNSKDKNLTSELHEYCMQLNPMVDKTWLLSQIKKCQ